MYSFIKQLILWAVLSFMKGRTASFFVLMAAVAMVAACSSNSLRSHTADGVGVQLPSAVLDERKRVMPHLHYELGNCGDDVAELSFHFVRQHGDSLLWVECVEKVPVELLEIVE